MNYIKLTFIDFIVIGIYAILIVAYIFMGIFSPIILSSPQYQLESEILATLTTVSNFDITNHQISPRSLINEKIQLKDNKYERERADAINQNLKELSSYLKNSDQLNNYGIYFVDLDSEYQSTFGINLTTEFYPASIYKVPLAMMILEQVDLGNIDLYKTVWHDENIKTIDRVMELMITESDNDAMAILENELGGYYKSQKKLEQDFGVKIQRVGQNTTPEALGIIFEILYNKEYLSVNSTQKLIGFMNNTVPILKDRIPAAIEAYNSENDTNLTVSTKIGTLDGVYQDSGIIWGSNSDYVLVILNKNRHAFEAIKEITEITKILLTDLE